MAKTCGDCIHAELCERIAINFIQEFSRDNPAYCNGFQDRKDFVEVVRCNNCKHFIQEEQGCNHFGYYSHTPWVDEVDFCSYGERREGE